MGVGGGHPDRYQLAGPGSVAGKDHCFELRVLPREPVLLLLGRPFNQNLNGLTYPLPVDLSPNVFLQADNLL